MGRARGREGKAREEKESQVGRRGMRQGGGGEVGGKIEGAW